MDNIIKHETINFNTLVTANSTQSLNFQSKLVNELTNTFTNDEQKWYIANLYMYLNYHQTNDFPINLDDDKLSHFVQVRRLVAYPCLQDRC